MKPSRLQPGYWVQRCRDCGQDFDSRECWGACPHRDREADYERVYDYLEEKIITNCRCLGVWPKRTADGWLHKCGVEAKQR